MKREKAVPAIAISAVLFFVVVTALPTAAASPDITVSIDDEPVGDGETVEVDGTAQLGLTVESETTLTSVRTETGASTSITGIDRRTYNETTTVSVTTESDYYVEVHDEDGGVHTHTITLTRPADSARDLQRDVRSLQNDIESLQDSVDELGERREDLRRTNDNLTERRDELLGDTDDDGDGGEGMPGFTVFAALVAVSAAGVALRLSADDR